MYKLRSEIESSSLYIKFVVLFDVFSPNLSVFTCGATWRYVRELPAWRPHFLVELAIWVLFDVWQHFDRWWEPWQLWFWQMFRFGKTAPVFLNYGCLWTFLTWKFVLKHLGNVSKFALNNILLNQGQYYGEKATDIDRHSSFTISCKHT